MGTANAVYTGVVQVTCTNGTFDTGWDNDNQYFEGKGDIAKLYCLVVHNTGYVSDNLSDPQLRWYQGVVIQDSPTATAEIQTPQVQESVTAPSTDTPETSTVDSQTAPSDSPTVTLDSPTSIVQEESLTIVQEDTSTVVVDTDTTTTDSSTTVVPVEPIETVPLPTPVPEVVQPQPIVVPTPQPQPEPVRPEPVVVPEPQPEPQPEPEPEPSEPESDVEPDLSDPEEELPVDEEQLPVEEPSERPVEEDTNEFPSEVEVQESDEPTPEPETQPSVEPELTFPLDTAPVTPITNEPMVTLDNGVVLTEEEATAIVLLSNPAELLSELFSDPGAVLSALGSVGADMTPEEREKSEKVILASVIAGNIATQAAATAGAVAAYRRKP